MELKKPLISTESIQHKLPTLLALVTFGLDSVECDKMQIRQSYFQNELTDHEKELTYLNNLQSICYPNGIQCLEINMKYSNKSKHQGVDKLKFSEDTADADSNMQTVTEHSILHYSITTCVGLKRYLSILLCKEIIPSDKLLIPTHLQVLPFAYILISSSPAFKLTRRVLKSIYSQTLYPYYLQVLGCNMEQQSPLAVHYPIRLEYQLSSIFNLLNITNDEQVYAKTIEDQRENKTIMTFEPQTLHQKVFITPNFSYKQLWNKISPQNLIQLFTCLLLERKVILISKDTQINAILIEALLDLLSPLDKAVFTNISFIKHDMIDYLDTPLPYVIGISDTLWNKIFMSKWNEVSDDTVAFYIDTSLLMTKFDLPTPPEPITRILLNSLLDLQGKCASMTDTEMQTMLKQAFFNYLLLLINDHRKCYKLTYEESLKMGNSGACLNAEGALVGGLNNNLSPRLPVDQFFQFEKYLDKQKQENQDFYAQFIDTQLFNDFVERSFRMNEMCDNYHLQHFFKCLDILNEKGDFTEVLYAQQEMINSAIMDLQRNNIIYSFQEVLDSYDRFLSSQDSSVFIKTVQFSSGIFKFKEKLICQNMQYEIARQSQIRSIINKPQSSMKKKPSKKNTTIGKRSLIQSIPFSRNEVNPLPKSNQTTIVSSAYYVNGPYNKVQTPKGLPSEQMSGKLLSGDDLDNSSTSNKDQLQSLEETKSETTNSLKSFFQMTFQKIQNKLKQSLANQDSDEITPKSPTKKMKEDEDSPYNMYEDKILNLTSLGFHLNDSKENTPKSTNTQLKLLYGQQSLVIGPKSNLNIGRPKCFSETVSTQFKRISQPIPSQNVAMQNIQDGTQLPIQEQLRPSAFSISNKSYMDSSPKSTTYTAESSSSLSKGRNDIQMGIQRTNLDRTIQHQTTITGSGSGSGGKHVSQQLAYSIFNQGVVILKEVNKDNIKKRLVKKFNINLDIEDAKNKKTLQPQILQGQTSNSARNSGQDCSPQESNILTQPLSGQKNKQSSMAKMQNALSSGKQPSRQKAISYQVSSANTANNTSKQMTTQPLKGQKNSMKSKREEPQKLSAGGVISLKKSSVHDKQPSFKTDRKYAQPGQVLPHHQQNFSIVSQQASYQLGLVPDKLGSAVSKKQQFDDIEGVHQRMRSISYTNKSDQQIKKRFKIIKDKSHKDLKMTAPTQQSLSSNHQMFVPSLQEYQQRHQDILVQQFEDSELLHPTSQPSDMMILEPFQLISTNPVSDQGLLNQLAQDFLRTKDSQNENFFTQQRLLEDEDYFLMTSPPSDSCQPLQLVLTKQLTLDGGGAAARKKGKKKYGDSSTFRVPNEPWSPQGKGSQATPNLGDDDLFSPGNKSSMNNSYTAENFSTLS